MFRRLARLVLALALLVAWQGALEHPLAHVHEALHAHGDSGDPGHEHQHGEIPHACDTCVAGAALEVAAPGVSYAGTASPVAAMIHPGAHAALLPRAPPPYRSQAPPFFS